MKEIVLKFEIKDGWDKQEVKRVLKADNAYNCLHELSNTIFRGYRKHGYSNNDRLNKLIENDEVNEAISLLEDMFHDLLSENDINLSEEYS